MIIFNLPFVYSLALFLILSFSCYFVFKQIYLTQNFEQKLKTLQNRTTLNQNFYEDFYKLGQLYLQKKNYNSAILFFQSSLKYLDVNDIIGLASLYNTIGFMYFNLKDYHYALYYYKKALFLIPDYKIILINLAVTYEKLQMLKKAYKLYLQVLSYDPNNQLAISKISDLDKKLEFTKLLS
jgi:tetratricopeptide (TPR) repeat protein